MGSELSSSANLVNNPNLKGCISSRILISFPLTSLLGYVNILTKFWFILGALTELNWRLYLRSYGVYYE